MSKGRKIFYGVWAGVTVVAILFGWVQTQRLARASAERESIRAETVAALLSEAQSVLDEAAEQTGALNLGNAQAGIASAVSLLQAAGRIAPPEQARAIEERIKAAQEIRAAVLQGDREKNAAGDLKREASLVRELMKQ